MRVTTRSKSRIRACARRFAAPCSAEGFLGGVEVAGEIPNKKLIVGLRYSGEREPVIKGIERVSRPSIRRYAGANSMPRVPHGMGVQVITTPLGVMTDREARRKKVGGEILLQDLVGRTGRCRA